MADIKELRKKKGLTQAQVAEKMDVSENTVQNWENGKTTPKPEVMNRLLKELGVCKPSEQARIIGELGVADYKESEESENVNHIPVFLFAETSGEFEKVKDCRATAEELDMLAYAEYMNARGRYAQIERRGETFPLEFAFFEKYGGFNKTMKKMREARKRLGGLYQDSLEFALNNPGYDYILSAFDKHEIVAKIGMFLGKNSISGKDDYANRIKSLYKDLVKIANSEVIYSVDGRLQNTEIVMKIAKIIQNCRYNDFSQKHLGQYEGYILIERKERDSKEYCEAKRKYCAEIESYERIKNEHPEMSINMPVFKEEYMEVLKLTSRGKQLVEWFEEE